MWDKLTDENNRFIQHQENAYGNIGWMNRSENFIAQIYETDNL